MTKKEMIIRVLQNPPKDGAIRGTKWIAFVIADFAHYGQYRDNGKDYIEHPKNCVENFYNLVTVDGLINNSLLFQHGIPFGIVEVAYLHDVVEDTELTLEDVEDIFVAMKEGDFYSKYIHVPLKLITHDKNEDYDTYIEKVMQHPTAAFVKMLDLADNMNLFGLSHLGDEEIKRTIRYASYFKRINDKYRYLVKIKECFANK